MGHEIIIELFISAFDKILQKKVRTAISYSLFTMKAKAFSILEVICRSVKLTLKLQLTLKAEAKIHKISF